MTALHRLAIVVAFGFIALISACAHAEECDKYCFLRQEAHQAYQAHHRVVRRVSAPVLDANGNAGLVISHKTGARAYVGARYAGKFQAYIDDLEAAGATVRFMGGTRRGHCGVANKHACGMALDVCQYARDVVDSRCHLPSRSAMLAIAERYRLFEGGSWCHGDRGHVEVITAGQAWACNGHRYIARR